MLRLSMLVKSLDVLLRVRNIHSMHYLVNNLFKFVSCHLIFKTLLDSFDESSRQSRR